MVREVIYNVYSPIAGRQEELIIYGILKHS